MQSFPQPPSAKEEKEYLKKCKEGDWQARNQLIERNMRLVAYIAKKYQQSGVEMEESYFDWNDWTDQGSGQF